MRDLHRHLVSQLIAACLVLLAASPVTAPFTTIELGDFFQHHHHPAHPPAPSPGRQAAVPMAKIAAPTLAAAIVPTTVVAPTMVDGHSVPQPLMALVQARERLQTVLRL
jgi:hypothetical protein